MAADAQLVNDLENAGLVSLADATKVIEQDLGKTRVAGSTVRADLGLPPPKT